MKQFWGGVLILLGVVWVMMCYLGTAMMSRGVDWFSEAFLPALLGLIPIGFGLFLILKRPKSRRLS
ncbi:hypothetical protein GJW-30_1_02185 [Variibacter gotjawalensis]|uniref:Uncharacterized protein n=1 Tax=Variibacter gotjawalensis TaxID=1333996 RepID=A0A0S3PUW6_9BRAD|nr:hypothetical protein [Variibacter gotjawalensis]NIK49978.1 cadmium resistance protein CadD (predicted permease) [Variibacter gotjawalensis]RZS45977.1 hypothetical protein EV661_4303 [Variibacter gotjawalensis]BAT59652.1 hypothetical protein GJW-30_1_02185 [Variibacter gotjawalensis]